MEEGRMSESRIIRITQIRQRRGFVWKRWDGRMEGRGEDASRIEMLSTILKSFECELPAKLSTDVNETYSRTPTNP